MRVDFYLLRDPRKQIENICCQLCAKAFDDGQNVTVISSDLEQAQRLDQRLWELPAARFIPHGLAAGPQAQQAAVVIATAVDDHPVTAQCQVVVNLNGGDAVVQLPPQHNVQRVLEVVSDSESARAQARRRYRQYQQGGAQLHTHELA